MRRGAARAPRLCFSYFYHHACMHACVLCEQEEEIDEAGGGEANGALEEDEDADEEGDDEYLRRLARESARMKA